MHSALLVSTPSPTAAPSALSAGQPGDYHPPMQQTLTLAHSPDSDDVVMWWPLTGMHGPDGTRMPGEQGRPAIDTSGLLFEPFPEDVQALNQRAIERGDLDITAISAHTYPHIAHRYQITSCGGSFGEGYGPKVVVRADDRRFKGLGGMIDPMRLTGDDITIAVPGRHTTAFLTLSLLLDAQDGPPFQFVEMRFDQIIGAVQSGKADAGLLIHEAQLTFEQAGLRMLADLGVWWQQETQLPLPLGLNVVKRDLDQRLGGGGVARVAELLSNSVAYARSHASESRQLLLALSGDRPEWRDDALVERYLAMYVSDLTADMGQTGREALSLLFSKGAAAGLCPDPGTLDVV